jgi:hypothetical protein
MKNNGEATTIKVVVLIAVVVALYFTGTTAYNNGKHDGYRAGYADGGADVENKFWINCQLPNYSCPEDLEKAR